MFRKSSRQRVARKSGKWNQILLTARTDEKVSASDNGNTGDTGGLDLEHLVAMIRQADQDECQSGIL